MKSCRFKCWDGRINSSWKRLYIKLEYDSYVDYFNIDFVWVISMYIWLVPNHCFSPFAVYVWRLKQSNCWKSGFTTLMLRYQHSTYFNSFYYLYQKYNLQILTKKKTGLLYLKVFESWNSLETFQTKRTCSFI